MKRSGFEVMCRLIGLVKPLKYYMLLAVVMGLAGHLCATFITALGGFAVLRALGLGGGNVNFIFAIIVVLALMRGVLRYGEQAFNHFIAFKLLTLIRDKVFGALELLAQHFQFCRQCRF